MVKPTLPLTLAALAALAGCTAEFGGRCAAADECDPDRICLQGYCLPPSAAGPDGEAPDGEASDGDVPDGEAPDGGDAPPRTCDPPAGVEVPAWDEALRPCADGATVALWRFDDGFEATVPIDRDPLQRSEDVVADRVRIDGGGLFGGAAAFDGAGDPNLDMVDTIRSSGPLTIELWLRLDGEGQQFRGLVSNLDEGRGRRGGFELFAHAIDGEPRSYRLAFAWSGSQYHWTDARFTNGTWAHLAATLDEENRLTLFVDGQGQPFDVVPIGDDPTNLRIGRGMRIFNDLRPVRGAIDELRISSIARDPADIARVAQGASRPQ